MEKCDGTMDELFIQNLMDEETGIAALFQIIMTLLTYQTVFSMTHNDLHTNNIAFVKTDVPFLYYQYNEIVYKVPTHGKIFKIIDFGRAIYKYNNERIFCSDSFSSQGDANTQYNFEPFFNPKKKQIPPNNSFDLCRLGCSIYDFIIENNTQFTKMDNLQKIICEWCSDDNGKNILYKNGEEKYPGFKLYKAIARKVNKHTPINQLENPIFKSFIYTYKNELNDDLHKFNVFNIDKFKPVIQ
jgi:hypothetical protein